MSGHSKWSSSIKHKKGAADAKRGKLFSKLSRAIIVAAREGGPDPAANLARQNAIEKARSVLDAEGQHQERAIAKGSGADTEGNDSFDTVVYEGDGPREWRGAGRGARPNPNRTASDVRHASRSTGAISGRRRCRVAVRAKTRWTPSAEGVDEKGKFARGGRRGSTMSKPGR